MVFIPDNIVLDTGPIIRLFQERVRHLNIPQYEFLELIAFVIAAVSYKEMSENKRFINDVVKSYEDTFNPTDLKSFEFALLEITQQMHLHFLRLGIYNYDSCSSPYHFKHMLSDGSIVLEFDYTDPEINW